MYLASKTLSQLSTDLKIIKAQLDHAESELARVLEIDANAPLESRHWPVAPELFHIKANYPRAVKRYKDVSQVLESTIVSGQIDDRDLQVLANSEIPSMVKRAQQLNAKKKAIRKMP